MEIGWEVNKFISPKLRTSRLPVSSFKNAIVQETSILKDYIKESFDVLRTFKN